MADFSLEDLAAPVATASPNFAVKVAAGALVFGCGLYRDYPGAFVGRNPSAFARGLMDTLCNDRPPGLPPPPTSPFFGGQCPVQYNVLVFFRIRDKRSSDPAIVVRRIVRLAGKIYGTSVVPVVATNGTSLGVLSDPTVNGVPTFTEVDSQGSFYEVVEHKIESVERVDGQPDNCGSPPSSYPPSEIPDSRRTGVVTNVYNDGSDFTIPLVYAPVSFSAPLTVNVGGVNFKFDFGGVTIGGGSGDSIGTINNIAGNVTKISNDTDIIRNDTDIIRNDTNVINNTVNKTEGDVTNLGNTINVVNTFISNAPLPPEQIQEEPPSEEPEKEGVSNLFAVRLKLTQIPINSKQQFGVGAPNVLYAGWFEFKRGTFCFPREPIAFQEAIFRSPVGADGYAFTLYVGYKGEASVIKLDTVSEIEA